MYNKLHPVAVDSTPKIWRFPKILSHGGTPIAGWFVWWKILCKWMISGYPHFRKTFQKSDVPIFPDIWSRIPRHSWTRLLEISLKASFTHRRQLTAPSVDLALSAPPRMGWYTLHPVASAASSPWSGSKVATEHDHWPNLGSRRSVRLEWSWESPFPGWLSQPGYPEFISLKSSKIISIWGLATAQFSAVERHIRWYSRRSSLHHHPPDQYHG